MENNCGTKTTVFEAAPCLYLESRESVFLWRKFSTTEELTSTFLTSKYYIRIHRCLPNGYVCTVGAYL